MNTNLSFDHLKEAQHYLDHLDDASSKNIGYSFLSFLKDQIPLDVINIYITNYTMSVSPKKYYILKCDRNALELFEKNQNTENNIKYLFLDDSIILNSKKMGAIYNTAFKKRLSEIIRDLTRLKSVIFEETL